MLAALAAVLASNDFSNNGREEIYMSKGNLKLFKKADGHGARDNAGWQCEIGTSRGRGGPGLIHGYHLVVAKDEGQALAKDYECRR